MLERNESLHEDGSEVNDFSDIDFEDYLGSMTLIIFFIFIIAFFFEFVTRLLDRFLQRNAPQLFELVQQLYKELMVCGFISIFIWTADSTDFVSEITGDKIPSTLYDFLHLLIFVTLMFYVFLMFYLISFSIIYMRKLGVIESKSSRTIEESYHYLKQQRDRESFWRKWVHPIDSWVFNDLQHQYHHHVIRSRFILQQGLTDRFNFGSYLRKCMRSVVAEMVKIHWSIWLLALCIIGINGLRQLLGRALSEQSSIHNFVGLSNFVVLIEAIIVYKCRKITKSLIKSEVLSAPITTSTDSGFDEHHRSQGLNGSVHSLYDNDANHFRVSLLPSHLDDYDVDAYVQVQHPHPVMYGTSATEDQPTSQRLSGTYEGSIFSAKLAADYGFPTTVSYSPSPSPRIGTNRNGPGPSRADSNDRQSCGSFLGLCCSSFVSLFSCSEWRGRFLRCKVRLTNLWSYPADSTHSQMKLYWFKTPKFLLYTLRMCLFIGIGELGFYLLYFINIIQRNHFPVAFHVAAVWPHLFTVGIIIPEFVIAYTIISSVGCLTNRRILGLTLKQQQYEGSL